MSRGRVVVAVAATVPLALATAYFAVLCVLAVLGQVLGGFVDLSQATWTSALDPAVWLGLRSAGGTGGLVDGLVGGAGAPGGSVGRYAVFFVSAMLATGSAVALQATWRWARR